MSDQDSAEFVLRLYVAGMTAHSLTAITTVQNICEKQLQGRCDLQVIDIYKQPELAKAEQIVAVPTLVRKYPLPLRKFIGDLSQTEKILAGLGIEEKRPK